MMAISYFIGDSLEPLSLWWFANGTLVDFSVAHSYSLSLATIADPATKIFTSTSGFTGAAGAGVEGTSGTPNLVKAWATSGELNAVTTADQYVCEIVATRTSDSRVRTAHFPITMRGRLG